MQHRVALEVAQRVPRRAGGGRRPRIAEALAAVLGAQPRIPVGRHVPRQARIERVLRRVRQRFAGILAAFLFAVGVRVVGAGGPAGGEREAGGEFDAARDGLVDIDRLAEGVDVWPVTEADAAWPVGRGSVRAINQASTAGDLVLEIVVEDRGIRGPAGAIVEIGAQFGGDARFRLQVRAAHERDRALATEAVDAWGELFDARRLVALAHAALDGPAGRGAPDQVAPGACLAAKDAVIVVARTDRQRHPLMQAPLVFHEQGFLREGECLRRDAVDHLGIPVLGADGGQVRAPWHQQLRVEHLALDFQRAGRARYRARRTRRNRAADGFRVVHHIAAVPGTERQARLVRQRGLLAVVLLLWPVAARAQRAELAARVVIGLARPVGVEHQFVVAVRGERQPRAHVVDLLLDGVRVLDQRPGRVDLVVRDAGFVAAQGAAAQRESQHVGLERAAQVELGALDVAELVVFLQRVVGCHRTGPALADLARDDVDHAAHGVRAIQRRHRTADDFDALNGADRRHEAGRGAAEAIWRDVAGRVLAPAVDQDQRVVARHAPDADVHAAGLVTGRADVDAFHAFKRLRQIAEALFLELFTRQHRDRGGRIADRLLEAGCRHDHSRHGCR